MKKTCHNACDFPDCKLEGCMVEAWKPKRGGKRPNAGRKSKYGEPTETISFRVPISLKQYLINLVNEKLNDKARV